MNKNNKQRQKQNKTKQLIHSWESPCANCREYQMIQAHWHQRRARNNPPLHKTQPPDYEIFLALPCPKSTSNTNMWDPLKFDVRKRSNQSLLELTWRVTNRSSIWSSFVAKSAPMVTLCCWLNFLFRYLHDKLMKHHA